MVLTLTLNPAVDQTAWVERFVPGTIHRVLQAHIDPAGKGINVSRMVHRLGWATIALGFLAGDTGNLIEKALENEALQHHFIRVPGQTRINTTVIDKSSDTASSFYNPGPFIPSESLGELSALVRSWLQGGRVLVLAGSVPPGVPENIYASHIRAAHEHGVIAILDADGPALQLGIEARPELIKPNVEETERLLGRRLPDVDAVARAARELARRAGTVIISMGAHGAICVQGERGWRLTPPKVERRSTVGSGDAMVAGLAVALARGEDIVAGLRLGTAAGAATAMSEGTALGSAEQVDALMKAVRIEAIA